MGTLRDFVAESNRIEGIQRRPLATEIAATRAFLMLEKLEVTDVEMLVAKLQPGAVLRRRPGLNVRVGNHVAPSGGPAIETSLAALLALASAGLDPWKLHTEYETLHPFTDGNGRSGRAIWAWQMGEEAAVALGFLHRWYYQTLERAGR